MSGDVECDYCARSELAYEMMGPKNPELAPNRVSIKPQGEEAVVCEIVTESANVPEK